MSDLDGLARSRTQPSVLQPAAAKPPSLFARAYRVASAPRRLISPTRYERVPQTELDVRKVGFRLSNRSLFFLLVVVPTFLTTVYMVAIASNQYISEAHFVVRSAQKQGASGLSAMLQGSGLSGIKDDSSSVIDYMKSRDVLKKISGDVGFREIVNRPGADFLARFPTFYHGESFEELFEHFSSIVTIVHDAATGINTLKVRAFRAEDAQRVAESLLEASEQLINRLNERSLVDAVSLATREVRTAEERSAAAQKALTDYRIAAGLVDTTSSAKGYLELIGGLERELAASRTQLTQTRAASPNNPNLQNLRDRVSALEQQIESERQRLFGSNTAMVNTFAEFQKLTIEAEFAAKAVILANTMLESARLDALRKQLYLDRVVEPNTADLSRYPRRFISIITVFGSAFMAYAVLWLVMANAREHAG